MEQELERVLRAAPRPSPPTGLEERLIAQVRLPAVRPAFQTPASPPAPAGWLRRWWPVLAPAAVSVGCAVGLVFQQAEIRELKRIIEDLSRDSVPKAGALPTPTVGTNNTVPGPDAAARTQQEVARLKDLASQLASEIAQLEQMRANNLELRAQLDTPPAGFLTPEETEALTKARERAESVACVNNLKQMALAMRTWAIRNGDMAPPDILSMANELNTPKILTCPGDRAREAAEDWASYTPANCSYEYLVPSVRRVDAEPDRVAFRCPIHGNVSLCDTSAQSGIAKEHPERLVQRNGKLYLTEPSEADQPAKTAPGGSTP